MSKLAGIRAYQTSGYYAGDLIGFVKKAAAGVKNIFSKGTKIVKQFAATPGGGDPISQALQAVGLSPDGTGARRMGARRRSRGITARELRGYRKVANLLHREGMVSRRGRGRR